VFALVLAASPLGGCPHDASLGRIAFVRAGTEHRLSLADCRTRSGGRAPHASLRQSLRSPDGRFIATVRPSGSGRSAKQTIWIADRRTGRPRPAFSETESYSTIGPGDTPGPIWLLGWSGDDQWIFFTVDPGGSGSIAADGLTLRVVSARGGPVHRLGVTLPYEDYLGWCSDRLVFVGGGDRVATHAKRLLFARPPDWLPRRMWNDRSRSFGSLACSPDGTSLAVLSQHSNANPSFFATRWQLWRVGVDGSRMLLDRPPAGSADESPHWSPDGHSLLFVRERQGHGTLMLLRGSTLFGPLAPLGSNLGYYGHYDWPIRWLP
jgi:WD40-like Beta Propeller Repeat